MDTTVRASRAKAILCDDVFIEAQNVVLNECVKVFTDPASSQEEIMEAHRAVRASEALGRQLQKFVDDGRLLERKQKKVTAS